MLLVGMKLQRGRDAAGKIIKLGFVIEISVIRDIF